MSYSFLWTINYWTIIDGLREQSQCYILGCYVNTECFNQLVYADDTVLLGPTQECCKSSLIHVIHMFHDFINYVANSKCKVVKSHSLKILHVPTLRWQNY